jgi:hypothetical protein
VCGGLNPETIVQFVRFLGGKKWKIGERGKIVGEKTKGKNGGK